MSEQLIQVLEFDLVEPSSLTRRQQQSPALSRSALRARNALVLEHLPLADALASATARRLFPLVEREDLIQVAQEALAARPHQPRCSRRRLGLPAHQAVQPPKRR